MIICGGYSSWKVTPRGQQPQYRSVLQQFWVAGFCFK